MALLFGLFHGDTLIFDYHFIFNLFEVLFNYIILFYIYTWMLVIKSTLLNEFRCWKVENLDDERSDENKNEGLVLSACKFNLLMFYKITRGATTKF